MRRCAERRSGNDIRPPYDVVARVLGIDVVGEERDVQEAVVGQVDFVLGSVWVNSVSCNGPSCTSA